MRNRFLKLIFLFLQLFLAAVISHHDISILHFLRVVIWLCGLGLESVLRVGFGAFGTLSGLNLFQIKLLMKFRKLNRIESFQRCILLILPRNWFGIYDIILGHDLGYFKTLACIHFRMVLSRCRNWQPRTLIESLLECRSLICIIIDLGLPLLFERCGR